MELLRWDGGCIREISLDKRCVEDSVPGSEGEEIWLVPEVFKVKPTQVYRIKRREAIEDDKDLV